MEGLYFHCNLSVCVCVRLVNKIQAEWMHRFDTVFAKWLLTTLAQTLLKSLTLGQRSRPQGNLTTYLILPKGSSAFFATFSASSLLILIFDFLKVLCIFLTNSRSSVFIHFLIWVFLGLDFGTCFSPNRYCRSYPGQISSTF